jgi:hypothetical protein
MLQYLLRFKTKHLNKFSPTSGGSRAPHNKPVHVLRPKRPVWALLHRNVLDDNAAAADDVQQARSVFAMN